MVFLSKECLLRKASSECAKRSISKDGSILSKFLYFYNYKESKGLYQFLHVSFISWCQGVPVEI